MEDDLYTCSHCYRFHALKMSSILRHIGRVHSHDPGFDMVCGIDDCPRTFKKYYSFRKHLHRKHPDILRGGDKEDNATTKNYNNIFETVDDDHEVEREESTEDKRLRSSALFLLKAKEIDRISQNSLESLMHDITAIVQMK